MPTKTRRSPKTGRSRRHIGGSLALGALMGATAAKTYPPRRAAKRSPAGLRERAWDKFREITAKGMGRMKKRSLGRRMLKSFFRTRLGQRVILEMV